MANYVTGLPGPKTERTSSHRAVMKTDTGLVLVPGGKVISGSASRDPLNTGDVDVLRAGLVMGEITASGKYAPSILGVLTGAYDKDGSNATSLQVSAATATEIVRRIGTTGTFKLTGPPTAAGTVATITITYSAVNTTTGVITISAGSADMISGALVQPTDGSETPKVVINDGYGVKVTDADDTSQDTPFAQAVAGGQVDTSNIVNVPSDTSLLAWLKSQLRANSTGWTFDDDF